jgi:hypothetical protein
MEHVGTWEFELDHVALAPDMVLAGTGLPVLLPVIPFALEMLALRRLTTTAFGTLMSLEPAVALILGLLALHQTPGLGPLVGILFRRCRHRRPAQRRPAPSHPPARRRHRRRARPRLTAPRTSLTPPRRQPHRGGRRTRRARETDTARFRAKSA